ncbi:MAG: 30S ribosomal protein S18 [Patescibacteria group bacterium]
MRKDCYFCKRNIKDLDYKDKEILSRFIDDLGKIKGPRLTGTCTKHQRQLAKKIKTARIMGILPFTTK